MHSSIHSHSSLSLEHVSPDFAFRSSQLPRTDPHELATLFVRSFPLLSVPERLALVLGSTDETIIATTSGGIQSGVLLSQLDRVRHETVDPGLRGRVDTLPVIFLDTGDLFTESIDYIRDLKHSLNLSVRQFRHGLNDTELQKNLAVLVESGMSATSAFDELTKVRPIAEVLGQLGASIWISGNRRSQSQSRQDLPFAEVQNGVLKVYPLADLSSWAVHELLREAQIPAHPLAGTYRSVGNRAETSVSNGPFEKSGRHSGEKDECGLHLAWVKRGKTLRQTGAGFAPFQGFPVVEVDF